MITREWAESHEGAGVVYRGYGDGPSEDGVILRCSHAGVFVRYRAHSTPQLTRFEDLVPLVSEAQS